MEDKPKIPSKKNIIKISVSFLIIICIIAVLASYLINDEFRNLIDTKVLMKEVTENTSNRIEINSDGNPYIYAFDKYITIFSKNVLNFYNQEANNVAKIDANITVPYMTSNDKYLVLAENGGQKLYFILDTSIQWEKEMDGEIYRVSINKNGYVSVLFKYKSVIVLLNAQGEELFRTYLATSYAVCSEISDNNKYLAIGQVDYSGTVLKSIVKLISVDSAIQNAQNSILYTYESESNKILSNLKFNSKQEAICMFDTYLQKVTTTSDERMYDIKNTDLFVDMNLEDNFIVVEKESSGLFSYQYQMNIKSTTGKSDKLYILENDMPKELKLTKASISIKLVNEVRVVSASGWLNKRYTTSSEIQDIVIGDCLMGIVYHNKIEVIGI